MSVYTLQLSNADIHQRVGWHWIHHHHCESVESKLIKSFDLRFHLSTLTDVSKEPKICRSIRLSPIKHFSQGSSHIRKNGKKMQFRNKTAYVWGLGYG